MLICKTGTNTDRLSQDDDYVAKGEKEFGKVRAHSESSSILLPLLSFCPFGLWSVATRFTGRPPSLLASRGSISKLQTEMSDPGRGKEEKAARVALTQPFRRAKAAAVETSTWAHRDRAGGPRPGQERAPVGVAEAGTRLHPSGRSQHPSEPWFLLLRNGEAGGSLAGLPGTERAQRSGRCVDAWLL